MALTSNQLQLLLVAYQNTHTRTKTFGSYDADDDVLCQLGLVTPKAPGTVGTRTTEKGDRVVQAALASTVADGVTVHDRLIAIHDALAAAHWLSGSAEQRIAALIAERDAALAGTHPVQLARSHEGA